VTARPQGNAQVTSTQFTGPIGLKFLQVARRSTGRVRLHADRVVQWTVNISAEGNVTGVIPHGKAAKGERPYLSLAPREGKGRSNNVAPLLITDNAQYVLGASKKGADEKSQLKSAAKHAGYLSVLKAASELHPDILAVSLAARSLSATDFPSPPTSEDLITFQVDGRNPHENPLIQKAWIDMVISDDAESGAEEEGPSGTDALTGERSILASNGPLIKNLPGGEATLIYQSRNLPTFVNYSVKDLNVSRRTIEDLSAGLEMLAGDPATSFTQGKRDSVGDRKGSKAWTYKMLHWLDDPAAGADPWLDLQSPSAEYLAGAMAGEVGEREGDGDVAVNIALVRGNYKRVAVLAHHQTTLKNARRNADAFRKVAGDVPMWLMERALASKNGNPDHHHVQALLAAPMLGTPLPARLAWPVVDRWIQTRTLDRGEAAILRLSLTLPHPQEEHIHNFADLPPVLKNAYALGQYAAKVHVMHQRVHPGVGQTLTDRHLRMLSVKPARTYGEMSLKVAVLLRGHARRKRSEADSMQADLGTATSLLTLPLETSFTLDQRGAFALGYDQVMQVRRRAFQAANPKTDPTPPTSAQGA